MKIAVAGAGSWGTAVAALLAEDEKNTVVLWCRRAELAAEINEKHTNSLYHPGIKLPERLQATAEPAEAFADAQVVVLAVPSQHLRAVVRANRAVLPREAIYLSLVKGIEVESATRPSELLLAELAITPEQIAVLSGPNHAEEVIRHLPTATVIAAASSETATLLQRMMLRDYFRVYTHDDVVGVELGGAVKNVLAIAVGIADGLGYGDNARAALITRGLVEMVRLGLRCGARLSTFLGLSGIGDLVATATSRHSRNRHYGEMLGRGMTPAEIEKEMKQVAEGARSCLAVQKIAREKEVEVPITDEVVAIIYEGKKPAESVNTLMSRAPKMELAELENLS